jgi:hypothetical protein
VTLNSLKDPHELLHLGMLENPLNAEALRGSEEA